MKKSYKSGPRNGGVPQGVVPEKQEVHSEPVFNSFSLDDLSIHQKTEEDESLSETVEVSEESEEEEERPMSEAARLRAEAILSRKSGSRASPKKRTSTRG